MNTILITGILGFVGSNLTKAILDRGIVPVGLDRSVSSRSLLALCGRRHPIVGRVDVTDLDAMVRIIERVRPDVIYHLAGVSHIHESQENPWPALSVNVMGTVAVLEAVRRVKPDTVVVCASSNHAYVGGPRPDPSQEWLVKRVRRDGSHGFAEYTPLNATDVYGASKAMCDRAVACYRYSFGLRVAALRHVNCYGPGDPFASHLVTGAILSCLKGERPRLRSDGSAVKGYLHVRDVCSAYLTVAEKIDDVPGHAVNVTSPACEASARAVAQAVMECAGLAGEPETLGQDVSQVGYEERLDASLLESLGWRPRFNLHSGIANALAWYREHDGMGWLTA